MPATTPPMRCEPCGTDMVHHADKLMDPTTQAEEAQIDPALGGLVEQAHTCPGCGSTKSRRGE